MTTHINVGTIDDTTMPEIHSYDRYRELVIEGKVKGKRNDIVPKPAERILYDFKIPRTSKFLRREQ